MGIKKVSLLLLCSAVITLLVVLAFRVRVAASADAVAVLRTSGMTCSSCSAKISQALEKLKGVVATEVDVPGGLVIVGYDAKVVQPAALAEKVTSAGFGSSLQAVLTPSRFKQITGRDFSSKVATSKGCCCGSGTSACGNKPI
jgi:copper chaperone CopZ